MACMAAFFPGNCATQYLILSQAADSPAVPLGSLEAASQRAGLARCLFLAWLCCLSHHYLRFNGEFGCIPKRPLEKLRPLLPAPQVLPKTSEVAEAGFVDYIDASPMNSSTRFHRATVL